MSTLSHTTGERERSAVGQNKGSSTVPSSELETTDVDSGDTDEEKGTIDIATDDDEGEYPQGLALTFIVLALGLSIFLVALDMVRLQVAPRCHTATDIYRLSLRPQFLRSQTSSTAYQK
jgi:hypothetical protein